ncbi:hypothetical protein DVH24_029453 [Malus domestica]|uniref:Uncharacterized protein n=1 Tax=Malus domestica TaxID=3750 RepID=A0A498HXM6_MALDO|nr:hypothetical protein DVH24_029453 [Malus domestica]
MPTPTPSLNMLVFEMDIDGSGVGSGRTWVRRKKIEDVICLQAGSPLMDKKNPYAMDFVTGHGNGGSKLYEERPRLALKSSRDTTSPTSDKAAMLFFSASSTSWKENFQFVSRENWDGNLEFDLSL